MKFGDHQLPTWVVRPGTEIIEVPHPNAEWAGQADALRYTAPLATATPSGEEESAFLVRQDSAAPQQADQSAWGALRLPPGALARARTLPNGIVEVNIGDHYAEARRRSPFQELFEEEIRDMERTRVEDMRRESEFRRRERERRRAQRESWVGSGSRPVDTFSRSFSDPEWLEEWEKMSLEAQGNLMAFVNQMQMLHDMEMIARARTFGMMIPYMFPPLT